MRKLIVSNFVTLDGYFEAPGGDFAGFFEYQHRDYAGDDAFDHYNAELWRRAMSRVLGDLVADGEWSAAQAARVATMVGAENARRVYGLGPEG